MISGTPDGERSTAERHSSALSLGAFLASETLDLADVATNTFSPGVVIDDCCRLGVDLDSLNEVTDSVIAAVTEPTARTPLVLSYTPLVDERVGSSFLALLGGTDVEADLTAQLTFPSCEISSEMRAAC